jgi:hypothetical protein
MGGTKRGTERDTYFDRLGTAPPYRVSTAVTAVTGQEWPFGSAPRRKPLRHRLTAGPASSGAFAGRPVARPPPPPPHSARRPLPPPPALLPRPPLLRASSSSSLALSSNPALAQGGRPSRCPAARAEPPARACGQSTSPFLARSPPPFPHNEEGTQFKGGSPGGCCRCFSEGSVHLKEACISGPCNKGAPLFVRQAIGGHHGMSYSVPCTEAVLLQLKFGMFVHTQRLQGPQRWTAVAQHQHPCVFLFTMTYLNLKGQVYFLSSSHDCN